MVEEESGCSRSAPGSRVLMAGRHARFGPVLESSPPRREEVASTSVGAPVKVAARDVASREPAQEDIPQMRHPPKRRASKPTKLSKEESIALQFAPYAETIRRISFMYTHHPVLDSPSEAHEQEDHDPVCPFSPMKPIDALLAFAKDFEITPLMLLTSEVRRAVVDAHKKRLEYLNVAVTMDRLFVDFLVVCSDLIAEKRPFRNVMGGYSPALRVQAVLGFLSLEEPGHWEGVVASRFESMNAMFVRQSLAEQEMIKKEAQKRQTEDFARKGLGNMWEQVHQVFLYFCPRPPPPSAEEQALARAQSAAAEEKEAAAQAPLEPQPQRRASAIQGKATERFGTLKKFQSAVRTLRDKLRVVQHINIMTQEEQEAAARRRRMSMVSMTSEGNFANDMDALTARDSFLLEPRPNVSASRILFGGGGVDPRTGGLPGEVVASLLDEAWDGAALLASSGALSTPKTIEEDSEESTIPITLPLPQLLRWKHTNVDAPTEPPTPSMSPPPASPGLKGSGRTSGSLSARIPRSGNSGGNQGNTIAARTGKQAVTPRKNEPTPRLALTPRAIARGVSEKEQVKSATTPRKRPVTASPRVAGGGLNASFRSTASSKLQTGRVGTKSSAPASFPARITLNERQTDHMRRPKPGPFGLKNNEQPGDDQLLPVGQKKPDPGDKDWNFTEQLFVERGGKFSDLPQCGITTLTKEDIALRKKILEAWGTGATRHDVIFDDAAYAIQQAAKRYITRMRMKGGGLLKVAKKAWLESNPPPPLWSKTAKINIGELLTLSRVFSIIPTVASESLVVEIALDEMDREQDGSGTGTIARTSIRGIRLPEEGYCVDWEAFKRICSRLATKYAADKHASNPGLNPSAPGSLVALFDLFVLILQPGSSTSYDPTQPRQWIRACIREYGQRENMARLAERDSTTRLSEARLQGGTGQAGQDGEGEEEEGSETLNMSGGSLIKKKGAGEGKQKAKSIGTTSEAAAAYANACANHGVEGIQAIATQLDRLEMDVSHYELKSRHLQAFVDIVSRSTCITHLVMSNSRLDGADLDVLCKALARNSSITSLDVSENQIGFKGTEALTEFIGGTDTLRQLNLMGTELTDAMLQHMLTEGFEQNTSIDQWDLSYNLLTDSILFYLEPLLLDRPAFQRLDLSWNLLSQGGVQSLFLTNVDRAKPKPRKKTGVFAKALVKVNLIVTKQAQRHILANWMGKNGEKRILAAAPHELSSSDFISIDVALRVKSLTDTQRCLLIRMFTTGRVIQPPMASQLLKSYFEGSDVKHQALELIKSRMDPNRPELVEEFLLETKDMFE